MSQRVTVTEPLPKTRQKRINLRIRKKREHQQNARTQQQQCFNRAKKKGLRNTMAEKKRRQETFSIRRQLANAKRKVRELTQNLDELGAKYNELQVTGLEKDETIQMLSHNQEETWDLVPEWYSNLEWSMRHCMYREELKQMDKSLQMEEMDVENEDDLIQMLYQNQEERWKLRDKLTNATKRLAKSKKRDLAKDQETKAERTRKEEEMKVFKQQLEGGCLECLEAKDKEVEMIKQRAQQTQKEIENELECSICKQLIIDPVILECTHSYCTNCIRKWAEVNNQCPDCRAVIQSQTRNLVLKNCIECIVKRLPPDEKATRLALVSEREATN